MDVERVKERVTLKEDMVEKKKIKMSSG